MVNLPCSGLIGVPMSVQGASRGHQKSKILRGAVDHEVTPLH